MPDLEEDVKSVVRCKDCNRFRHDFKNNVLFGRCMIEDPHEACACSLQDMDLTPEQQVSQFLAEMCCIWAAAMTLLRLNMAEELFENGMGEECYSCTLGSGYLIGGCNAACCKSFFSYCTFELMGALEKYKYSLNYMDVRQFDIMKNLITDHGRVTEPWERDTIEEWRITGQKPLRISDSDEADESEDDIA